MMLERSLRGRRAGAAAGDVRALDRDPEPPASSSSRPTCARSAAPARIGDRELARSPSELVDPGARRARCSPSRSPCSAGCSSCCRARSSAGRCARPPGRRHGRARRRQRARRSTRARPRSRSRPRRWPASFLGDAVDVRPARGPDAADLRLRGGGDRRPRLAVGHARRRHRARRRADRRRADRPAVLRSLAGHLVFLAVLVARRASSARASADALPGCA